VVFVGEGLEVCAAAGFVEAGCADDYQFLALAEALGVDGGGSADHADGGEFGDLVGEGHEDRDWAEGLVGEGGVEAGEDDALAEVNEFHGEVGDAGVEELDFVEADDVDLVDAAGFEEFALKAVGCWSYDGGVVGLGAVAGDGGAVVAEVDVGFEAGDALAGDAGALETANELLGLAGEHGTDDDFDPSWSGAVGHSAMVLGLVVDFWELIFWRGGVAFLQGFSRKVVCRTWFFDGEIVVDCWRIVVR
jgi:hypothetical protein